MADRVEIMKHMKPVVNHSTKFEDPMSIRSWVMNSDVWNDSDLAAARAERVDKWWMTDGASVTAVLQTDTFVLVSTYK